MKNMTERLDEPPSCCNGSSIEPSSYGSGGGVENSGDDAQGKKIFDVVKFQKENLVAVIRHGSEDSVDKDVVHFLKKLPETIKQCQELCLISPQDSLENRNIAVVDDATGVVIDCFKGQIDELNNSLYFNYFLHEQKYKNPIQRPIRRVVASKIARAFRSLLTRFSRSILRSKVKIALNHGDLGHYISVLSTINFDDPKLQSEMNDVECCKSIAFQIAQTLLLCKGIEVYTKSQVSKNIQEFQCYMNRDKSAIQSQGHKALTTALKELLSIISRLKITSINDEKYIIKLPESQITDAEHQKPVIHKAGKKKKKKDSIQLIEFIPSENEDKLFDCSSHDMMLQKSDSSIPLIYQQSNGIIINVSAGCEECLYYPLDIYELPNELIHHPLVYIFSYQDQFHCFVHYKGKNQNVDYTAGCDNDKLLEDVKKIFITQLHSIIQEHWELWTKFYYVFAFTKYPTCTPPSTESEKPTSSLSSFLEIVAVRSKLTNELLFLKNSDKYNDLSVLLPTSPKYSVNVL